MAGSCEGGFGAKIQPPASVTQRSKEQSGLNSWNNACPSANRGVGPASVHARCAWIHCERRAWRAGQTHGPCLPSQVPPQAGAPHVLPGLEQINRCAACPFVFSLLSPHHQLSQFSLLCIQLPIHSNGHPVAIFPSASTLSNISNTNHPPTHIIKMRFSAASVALLAGAVAAVPQYPVQPISQISDGQIQAPPATPIPSVVPTPGSSATPVPLPSAPGTSVVPSAVVPGKLCCSLILVSMAAC